MFRFFTQNNPDTLVDDIPNSPQVYGNLPTIDAALWERIADLFSAAGILALLGILWNIYTILAYILSFILLIIYIYASIRYNQYSDLITKQIRDEEALYDEYYRGKKSSSRLDQVVARSESDQPDDWKLAIIEADIILDTALKEHGYAGTSLGERLRGITPSQLSSIDDAWEAHKVRNQIAHQGSDFILTRRIASETIARYRRVFAELGVA